MLMTSRAFWKSVRNSLRETEIFLVTPIDSATDALQLLKKEQFDAIISDYQMPGMNGIQFLVEVRRCTGQIPFIIFTGRGREEIVIQALNAGADFYLQKGGSPEAQFAELSHKIQIAVENFRSREKIQYLNRLYSVLSATNKAICTHSDKKRIFLRYAGSWSKRGNSVWHGSVFAMRSIILSGPLLMPGMPMDTSIP